MRNVLIVLVVIVVALVGFIQTRPATFHIERSAVVSADPAVITAHIADFHAWADWSPWEKMDPAMKKTYTGDPGAVGSTYSWVGNDKVGEGKMTITDVKPGQSVTLQLDFIKPFASTNVTTFNVAPEGSGAKVTWNMDGKNNFMSKAMCIFMNMDSMVGPDFEHGLAKLKAVTEAAPAAAVPAAAADSAAATTKK
jgi:hypothetical protein